MNWIRVVGVALLACGLSVFRVSAADEVQANIEVGNGLLAAGKCEEAIKAFQEVVADKAATPDQQAEAQLRVGQGYASVRKYEVAISEFRKVIESYPDAPVDIPAEAQRQTGHSYFSLLKYQEALLAFRKVIESYPKASVDILANAQQFVGHSYFALGQYKEAIPEFLKTIEVYPTASAGNLAEAQLYMGYSYRSLGKHEEAIAEFRKVMENYPGTHLVILAEAQLYVGYGYRDLGKHEEAITEFRKVMDKYPGARWGILADAGTCVGDSYAALGKWPEAVQAYVEVIKLSPPPEAIVGLRKGLSKVVAAPDSTAGVLDVTRDLHSVMLANPGDRTSCEAILALIADLLLDQGQFDAALAEARILMQVSGPDNVAKAGERLTMALKGTDGNLVRVNQFIKYQKWGRAGEDGQAGTADDLADPLASVAFPGSEDRDKQFSEALKKLPTDWAGRLARANLFRYWGKPREALKELKMAFALCPTEQQALQNITDGIAQVLCQLSGDPKAGERFVAFLNHGAAGPDGQPGTADDLVDPLAEYAGQ